MKKILFIMLMLLTIKNVNASICSNCIVMDSDTNRVLFESNVNKKMLIASTTKIMTAMVVINNANLDDVIEVDESVLKSYGSGIYIEVGEHISIRDLLYGLMLRSGNDAAIMLANYVGGSIDGFSLMMNELASSLGMKDTVFYTPHGLDNDCEGNISTAYDMALLMSYAIKNEEFKKITSTKHYIVKTDYKTYEWFNKNKLLSMYEYSTGGKTGFTKKARRTLVTSASKNNKNLVIVTLNQGNDFNIHKNLYEQYFKKYQIVNVVNKKKLYKKNDIDIETEFNMLLSKEEKKYLRIELMYTNEEETEGYLLLYFKNDLYFKEPFKYKKYRSIFSLFT